MFVLLYVIKLRYNLRRRKKKTTIWVYLPVIKVRTAFGRKRHRVRERERENKNKNNGDKTKRFSNKRNVIKESALQINEHYCSGTKVKQQHFLTKGVSVEPIENMFFF